MLLCGKELARIAKGRIERTRRQITLRYLLLLLLDLLT